MVIYWKNPDTGLVEGIGEDGRIQSIQRSLDQPFDISTKAGFTEVQRPDGSLYYVENGVEAGSTTGYTYSPMMAGVIAAEIASGGMISMLHEKNKQFPPYVVIMRWIAKHQEFKEMMDLAIKERAYLKFEQADIIAQEQYLKWKDDPDAGIQAAKLKIDTLKFLTEKGDRDKFGNKPTSGEGGGIQIFIDTGITRISPENTRDVSPKKIEGT